MKRLLASVAISALALSGAAFAADAPAAVQKDQAPMTQGTNSATNSATTPTKPTVADSHAKKPVVKKSDKSSMNTPAARGAVQTAQAPMTSAPAKSTTTDDSHAKKPVVVKKSDTKASSGADASQAAAPAKPATR